MNAETLRDAITNEMMNYRRPKLATPQPSYNLRPVTVTDCNDNSLSSPRSREKCQQSTVDDTSSQSESSALTPSTDVVNVAGSADVKAKPEVPGISTAKVEVDGNSVEMPSATASQQTELQSNCVTMLSARSVNDTDVKLNDEICHCTSGNNSNWINTDTTTDSTVARDNWTDSTTPVIEDTRSDSNTLFVNTDPPQADDAKARIKAALLNSGRRRMRLRKSTPSTPVNPFNTS